MSLRATRQLVEISKAGSGKLRATRQIVEISKAGAGKLRATRQLVEVLVPARILWVDTVGATDTYANIGIFNHDIEYFSMLLAQEYYAGGTTRETIEHNITRDYTSFDTDGEPYTVHYGLYDEIQDQFIPTITKSDRIRFDEIWADIFYDATAVEESVTDSLSLTDEIDLTIATFTLTDTIGATDSYSDDHTLGIIDELTLTQSYVSSSYLVVTTLENDINITDAFIAELSSPDLCGYSPFVGDSNATPLPPSVTAPTLTAISTITLSYPVETPTSTVTIRVPEMGNKESEKYQRINRVTRGGTLIIYADPLWVKEKSISIQIDYLSETESQNVLDFMVTSLGKLIKVVDHESRSWIGLITNPNTAIIRSTIAGNSLSLDIDLMDIVELDSTIEMTITDLYEDEFIEA